MKQDDRAMLGCVFPLILFMLVCGLCILWQIAGLINSWL